ncbi:MAG: flagellar M-ring protein FliF [Spirochaetia bacterium]|nr:flagellar M-ring protein FliF [Spirochaetia bacterium]MBR5016595.1 flagellar M-ring protein FliF [Spirochaetia bacterium]
MKGQIKEFFNSIGRFWKKLRQAQRVSIILILAIAFALIVFISSAGSTSFMTPLFTARIADTTLLNTISLRLDQEGVSHKISDGMIYLQSRGDAQRMIALLMREDLVPKNASPWDVFKMDRWTTTDFERNVNLRRAISVSLEQHIESLVDVDRARITLVMPEKSLFTEDQKDVSASIIITPHPGSDIVSNPKKIQGIIKLVKFAVEGLEDKNITISDTAGNVLSDFAGMAASPVNPEIKPMTQIPEEQDIFDRLPVSRNIAYAAVVSLAVLIFAIVCIMIFGKKKKEAILEDARNMASQNPEEIARLVKTWLSED